MELTVKHNELRSAAAALTWRVDAITRSAVRSRYGSDSVHQKNKNSTGQNSNSAEVTGEINEEFTDTKRGFENYELLLI